MVREGRSTEVLVTAPEAPFRRLRGQLEDVRLVRINGEEATATVLGSHPRVFAWLDGDPSAGLAAMSALRAARSGARLLFLTPRGAEAERLAALAAGVDEVLTGPMSSAELAARIRLQLQRTRPGRGSRLRVGKDLELDLDRRDLLRDGTWVHLRPKEASLLELFARAPGRVLTRDHILERVWGPRRGGDPRTVDVHVRWLRSKIEPDPHDPVRLRTVRGVGYRLDVHPLTER
jgi:DNA-binding response OmpR family regulator